MSVTTNLFYVNKLIAEVIAEHVDADGVITEQGVIELEELELDKAEVIDSLIKTYKNQQVMIDGIDAEMTRLKLRKTVYQSVQGSVLKTILPYLTEGEKIETAEYILKWTTSSPLDGLENYDPELCFANKEDLLSTFVVKKVTPDTFQFDKASIKKALKTDEGSKLLPVDIYVNTTKNLKIT